jgi:hypothetical protein
MDYNACLELHRELVYRLKRELTFYRSLYVLIERQREAAEKGAEAEIALHYGELSTIMGGLSESQFAIHNMREKEPELFERASRIAPVPELVKEASDILTAAHESLKQGTRAAKLHYRKLQAELGRLGREHEAVHAYNKTTPSGRFLNGTR